jgi:hypothetical protein
MPRGGTITGGSGGNGGNVAILYDIVGGATALEGAWNVGNTQVSPKDGGAAIAVGTATGNATNLRFPVSSSIPLTAIATSTKTIEVPEPGDAAVAGSATIPFRPAPGAFAFSATPAALNGIPTAATAVTLTVWPSALTRNDLANTNQAYLASLTLIYTIDNSVPDWGTADLAPNGFLLKYGDRLTLSRTDALKLRVLANSDTNTTTPTSPGRPQITFYGLEGGAPQSPIYSAYDWGLIGGGGGGGGGAASTTTALSRDSASSVSQTVNANGSVTQVIYSFISPQGTITDTYTYGANSTTEPTSVTRGSFVSTATDPISDFVVSADGNQLTYSVSGAPITALTGTLLGTDTADRTLTHVSSGVALIGGESILNSDTGITVTLTSTTPTLTSAVTGMAVTNNSTRNPPTALTWSTANGGSQAGAVLTLAIPGNGSISAPSINSANPFEVLITLDNAAIANALVVYLDNDNTANFSWDATNTFLLGAYNVNTSLYAAIAQGAQSQDLGAITFPQYVKLKKSGSDLILQQSTDNKTFTTAYTSSGVLTGQTLYLKALLAGDSNRSADVKLYL